jgi:hypothetical protein
MLMTISSNSYESLPAGMYRGTFASVEADETSKGKAWKWKFNVRDPKAEGKTVCEFSDAEGPPTLRNKTGRFLQALAGKALAEGTGINPDDYVGKSYLLVIEPKPDKPGETRLSTFSAI